MRLLVLSGCKKGRLGVVEGGIVGRGDERNEASM